MKIEEQYKVLVTNVLNNGTLKEGRNGNTLELIGETLKMDLSGDIIPMITSRKIFSKGIIGEWLGFIQGASSVKEFETLGCPYWKLWGEEDGSLKLDYTCTNKLDDIVKSIKEEPNSRKHIISLWSGDKDLSLEPCHYAYQFIVSEGKLNIIWTQRSADIMIGVPSDMVLASLYLKYIAMHTGYEMGVVTMNFGSLHMYEEHKENALEFLHRDIEYEMPTFTMDNLNRAELTQDSIKIIGYESQAPIKFKLKA